MGVTPPRPGGQASRRAASARSRWWLAVPTVGGTCLLLMAIALVVYLLVQGNLPSADEPNPGMSVEMTKLPPIPTESGPAPTMSVPLASCETIISSDDAETTASPPITLTVGSVAFSVVPVVVQGGEWEYPTDYAGTAAWVCGTVINYVLEVEPTEHNGALLADLAPGDEMALVLSSGTDLLFRFAERQDLSADDGTMSSLLAQSRPRLTVINRGGENSWQVAIADYVAEAESARPPVTALARVDEPVRVEDVLLTVTKGHTIRSGIELEPETMVYLVEYAIENVGTEPWRSDWVTTQLQDGAGNRYLVSPFASAAGEYGPLPGGEVTPGAIVRGSAGYIVPEKLAGPALIWTFSPQTDARAQANVVISYQADALAVSPDQFSVAITDVFLNLRGDVLHIEGEIRNAGDNPFAVGLSDIGLTSSAGMTELHLAAPPLPWTIEPGQTQVIELQYAKPDASAALLTLLGYSFEVQGLR